MNRELVCVVASLTAIQAFVSSASAEVKIWNVDSGKEERSLRPDAPLTSGLRFSPGGEELHAVNDLGTQHLASAARAAGIARFVFTSTGLVYGGTGGRLASEDDPCAPALGYPASKLAAERALLGTEGLDVRILRLPFVYGDGDPHIAEVVPMMRGFPPIQPCTSKRSLRHKATRMSKSAPKPTPPTMGVPAAR